MSLPVARKISLRLPSAGSRLRSRRGRPWLAIALFLGPWLVGMVGLTVAPILTSFYYSLTDFKFFGDTNFVGFENYAFLFTDPRFATSLGVTFTYVGVSTPLKLALALVVALMLKEHIRGIGLYRAAFYLPSLLGGSVAAAILWRQMFGAGGALDQVFMFFGADSKSFVSSPDTSIWTLIALAVWQFGAPMVIFLAALHQVPQELYEAASLDGASYWRKLISVTLPMISPFILFNGIMQIITSFQSFTPAYIISGGSGGPADSTLVFALYLYEEAFTRLRMGYASAMAWVLLGIIAVFTLAMFLTSGRWVFNADEKAKR
ncbi:sugar ABC transporter permease [soil metagenome]